MTAVWGPLGWMTLHSVACAYPEIPTQSEKDLMTNWLDMFRDTITCPSCKGHFTDLLGRYRAQFPNMMRSRQDFTMFTFRAHNAVNKRLRKPLYSTLAECMETLRNNVKHRKASDYRISYINHITRHWRTIQDVSGIVATKKIAELKKIEMEYIAPRDTNFEVELHPDVVVLPRDTLEEGPTDLQRNPAIPRVSSSNVPRGAAGFRITAGGLRLRL